MDINDEIIRLLFLICTCIGGYHCLAWCYSKVDYRTRRADQVSRGEPHYREARLDT